MFIDAISPIKDVDCLTTANLEEFAQKGRHSLVLPCTLNAVLELLKARKITLRNKEILVIGKGKLVGSPLIQLLELEKLSFKAADVSTPLEDLQSMASAADIIFSGTGKPDLVPEEKLKKGCVIIDIGTSPDPNRPGKVRGDFSEETKKRVCSFYSPVPKGVGPLVIASLLNNTFRLWKKQCA